MSTKYSCLENLQEGPVLRYQSATGGLDFGTVFYFYLFPPDFIPHFQKYTFLRNSRRKRPSIYTTRHLCVIIVSFEAAILFYFSLVPTTLVFTIELKLKKDFYKRERKKPRGYAYLKDM